MKINKKLLSIPPYISTSWDHIRSLRINHSSLIISLTDGTQVEIPDLKPEIIEAVFLGHASFLDSPQEKKSPIKSLFSPDPNSMEAEGEMPFRLGFGTFDALGSALQHNPAHANSPDLPKEMLNKIAAIAKIVAPDNSIEIPKAEPKCNCVHCQIARAIFQGVFGTHEQNAEEVEEEIISAEDLKFQQWDIEQTGDKLYTVINRLDTKEKYSVYLGHPVGCTCGKEGCEHILAVLKS